MASLILGGGRVTKESVIDLTVGIQLFAHLGDLVSKEKPFACLYGNDPAKVAEAKSRLLQAYTIEKTPVSPKPVIREVILE